jgi:hypothetical protein
VLQAEGHRRRRIAPRIPRYFRDASVNANARRRIAAAVTPVASGGGAGDREIASPGRADPPAADVWARLSIAGVEWVRSSAVITRRGRDATPVRGDTRRAHPAGDRAREGRG